MEGIVEDFWYKDDSGYPRHAVKEIGAWVLYNGDGREVLFFTIRESAFINAALEAQQKLSLSAPAQKETPPPEPSSQLDFNFDSPA